MAGLAFDRRMGAKQREGRHRIVVETPVLPVDWRVAAPAIFGKTTLVPVVLRVARSAVGGRVPESLSLMAGRALGLGVFTEQREPREVVIEKDTLVPCRLAMTVDACVALRSLVRIVFSVTVVAAHGQRDFKDGLDMTEVALEFAVRSAQRIIRIRIVIENAVRPVIRTVARLAAFSEVAFVVVFFEVTGYAGHLQLVCKRVLAVTVVASDFGVPSCQQKVCVSCMVEGRVEPIGRLMAIAALGAAATIMCVVVGMAVVAGGGCLGERLIFVTVEASGRQVFAEQRVAGNVVVEFDFGPAGRRMAVATFGAHGFAVNVVFFVAGKARGWRITVLFFCLVAVAALRLQVLPVQGKIGQRMVKIGLVEAENVSVAALMVRVAAGAFLRARISGQAVKPALGFKVCGDVIMTVKTQLALFAAFEFLMTVAALGLQVRMAGDHLAGHDKRLYLRPYVLLRCQKQHKKESGYYRCLSHRR